MFAFYSMYKCASFHAECVHIHFELAFEALAFIVPLRVMIQNTLEVLCIPLSCLIPCLSPFPFSLFSACIYIFTFSLSLSLSLSSLLLSLSLSPRLKFSLNVYLPNHEVIIQRVFNRPACATMTSVCVCVCVCVCVLLHTHTHTHNTHTHTHAHTHLHTHTHTHRHAHVHTHTCV